MQKKTDVDQFIKEYKQVLKDNVWKVQPSIFKRHIVPILTVIICLILLVLLSGCTFDKEDATIGECEFRYGDEMCEYQRKIIHFNGDITSITDQEIKDEYEKRFGEGVKLPTGLYEAKELELPYKNETNSKSFYIGGKMLERIEPEICIQEKYEQIKDTILSPVGTIYIWKIDNYYSKDYICDNGEPICLMENMYKPFYTKEEIQSEFFVPIFK